MPNRMYRDRLCGALPSTGTVGTGGFPVDRCSVEVSSWEGLAGSVASASPALLASLGLSGERPVWIRFGIQSAPALIRVVPELPPGSLILSASLAKVLTLGHPLQMTAGMNDQGELALGPLVGLLISQRKLGLVLAGLSDSIYGRYARHAREVGTVLCFFTLAGLNPLTGTVRGYLLGNGEDSWEARDFPIPRVIYDRCFGDAGRWEAVRVRELTAELGCTVVNRPVKITKLGAFEALLGDPEVDRYLPYTIPFSPQALGAALDTYPDLYLKPNALYKGKGVLRLTRGEAGWILHAQGAEALSHGLPDKDAVARALAPLTERLAYVIQEGLALATYFGNRFDFRSLVQKGGSDEWTVSGLVARLAPVGGTVTSPRSGGLVVRADAALRHAFPDRWQQVLKDLEQASLAMARKLDARLGPCVELGLDIGVLQDGSVKLIEANGKPLRVSLQRLREPLITERIDRYPIHWAAAMDLSGPQEVHLESEQVVNPAVLGGGKGSDTGPLIGVMLNTRGLRRLHGGDVRYHAIVAEARQAGASLCFFTLDAIDRTAAAVDAWVEREGEWVNLRMPLPDVIYNRATYRNRDLRAAARTLLTRLVKRNGVILLNGVNAFGKWDVCRALSFFADTADLTPETVEFADVGVLERMLQRHGQVFVKANQSSHGADVLKVEAAADQWQVQGHYRGAPVRETFPSMMALQTFLYLLRGNRRWVIQQAVDLMKVNDRIFDIRAIVQKNGEGEWTVPLILVRWARPGAVVTNTSLGAEPMLPAAFLEIDGGSNPVLTRLEPTVTRVALQAVAVLEANCGRLGEVGVDIGLDTEGRAWVFEANSKPFHRKLPGLAVPLVRNPVQYAVRLTAQKWEGRRSGLTCT